jgi:hypothetical protein
MDKPMRYILVSVVLLVAVFGALIYFLPTAPAHTAGDEAATRATVTAFGAQLQNVSPLAANVSTELSARYGNYVTPTLLASWKADPAIAPGRKVSSPWPDHIQIENVAQQGEGYIVTGGIVFMTKTGLAGVTPVVLQVVPENGTWLIAAYQEQATSTTAQ